MHPDAVKDTAQMVMNKTKQRNPFKDNQLGNEWLSGFLKSRIKSKSRLNIAKGITDMILMAWANTTEAYNKNGLECHLRKFSGYLATT